MTAVIDVQQLVTVAISVALGSTAATLIVYKLISYFSKQAIRSALNDGKIRESMHSFVEETIVRPLNETNNEDIRRVATEALEIALNRMKRKK